MSVALYFTRESPLMDALNRLAVSAVLSGRPMTVSSRAHARPRLNSAEMIELSRVRYELWGLRTVDLP